jgi:excinuclease UvrABC nuclease subunit
MEKHQPFEFTPADWFTPNTYDRNFKTPPDKSGVYLLVHPKKLNRSMKYNILYVGSAKSLHIRYGGHEVLRFLKEHYDYVQFYFKECDQYRKEEKALIKLIQPRYNKQHKNGTA